MKYCNDDNPKPFEVEYDVGPLEKIDIWHLCKDCLSKQEFLKFRIRVEKIRDVVN